MDAVLPDDFTEKVVKIFNNKEPQKQIPSSI